MFLDLIDVPHLSCNFYPAMMLHKTKVTEALNSNQVVVLKFIYFSFVPLCSVFPRCPAPVKEGTIRKRSHGAGWQFLGQRVCFNAFIQLSCLSRRLCSKFLKAIREGALEPPIDGRTVRTHRDEPKRDHARSFYQWLYDHLAEPLAEGLDPELLQELQEIEEEELMDEFSEWIKVDPRTGPSESNQNPVAAASLQPSQKEQRPGAWLWNILN